MNSNNISFIQKSFDITVKNPILAQPFIIFMIVLSFTLAGVITQTDKVRYYLFFIANILLACAFIAGWFFMLKQGIYLNKRIENGEFSKKEDQAAASFALSKAFFHGVGDMFLHTVCTVVLYVVVAFVVGFLSYKIGIKYLPPVHLDWKEFYSLSNATTAEIQKYIFSLSFEQIKALNIWMVYVFNIVCAFSFATMFVFPALMDIEPEKDKFFVTPFKAFWHNFKFLFKNFLGSIGVLLYLIVLNTLFSVFSIFFNLNIIFMIIGIIASFYFVTYAAILIFLYYEDRK